MRGKRIYVVDEERVRKHKRDTYLMLGGGLSFIIALSFLPTGTEVLYGTVLLDFSDIKFVVVAWLSILSVILIILWAGVRLQPFAIYERGIMPPLKPWGKMFAKEYFIPYERIERIDTERWKIIEKGGRESNLRSWFLFNFVRSGKEADKVEDMLKVIAEILNERDVKEIREGDIQFM